MEKNNDIEWSVTPTEPKGRDVCRVEEKEIDVRSSNCF